MRLTGYRPKVCKKNKLITLTTVGIMLYRMWVISLVAGALKQGLYECLSITSSVH
ncbi:hypothetical protein HMPREF1585_00751 [Gardnerella vaginalis JCP8481B]|nr:hypothetical protein HMPREF1585_00751 [Gardnerella vaginalis JCP8481B]